MTESQSSLVFAVTNGDPIADWTGINTEMDSFQPSLLAVWKKEYECWRHHYQRFRDAEQKTFYVATDRGETPQPVDAVVRLHRRALLSLFHSGELTADHLLALPLVGEEAQERLDCERRLRTLLESLQETLELWHPVNMERIEEKKALFAQ